MFRDEKKLVETPMIPISLGELFDKITILEIKLEQITNKRALKNVNREYNLLLAIYKKDFSGNNGANQLMIKLKLINQKLWKIEDKIRDKESLKQYMDADEKINEKLLKISYYNTMLSFLEEVIKSLNQRTYIIKNAIDFQKFIAGYS